MQITRNTPTFKVRITDVVIADCPNDGGKWAIICEHYDDASGEWLGAGIIQDTNKARLGEWRKAVRGAGYTEWCPECQEAHADKVGA